jgi:hypothetical protein
VSLGIDNTIPAECVAKIEHLVHCVLDPIREHWGLPIRVTSGYRCPELNDEVGGVEDSYHMEGCAVDISATDPARNIELMSLIRAMHLNRDLKLLECYPGPQYKYIHVAYSFKEFEPYPFF